MGGAHDSELCEARALWDKSGPTQSKLPERADLQSAQAKTVSGCEVRAAYRPFLVCIPTAWDVEEGVLCTPRYILGQLPRVFKYAVEIRNAGLLGSVYRETLEKHGIAHVYNHWSYMPPLAEQHQRMERFTAPFTVLRLLTPLKMSYEAAKARAEPYNKIVGELPEMRRDMVDLVKKAIADMRQAYVVVNNRSEGNAPLTIQALIKALQVSKG